MEPPRRPRRPRARSGPHEGAWFHGRNKRDGAERDSRSQVHAALPEKEFACTVLGSGGAPIVRWTGTLTAHGPGTTLTQT
ncbi:hypothetical protein ACQYWQ_14475 [Streptomyces sp. P6-2-1]|uniref:hypothetical protein n=1 Tax=Streptomyces sp. P6-2-1 TaxID=3422591 RepID=UPI003D35C242